MGHAVEDTFDNAPCSIPQGSLTLLVTILITMQWINISSIIYGPTIFFIKLSILLQYQRIFVPNRKSNLPLFVGIQACIWSSLLFYLADIVITIMMREPCVAIWNSALNSGKCFDINGTYRGTGLFNVVSDFAILRTLCFRFVPLPSRAFLWVVRLVHRS